MSRNRKGRAGGLTMLELLVLMALTAVFGLLIVRLMSSVLQHSARDEVRVRLQQKAVLLSNLLAQDIALTNPAGLSLFLPLLQPTEPTMVAVQPITLITPDATVQRATDSLLLWAFVPSERRLIRKEWLAASPPPVTLPPVELKRLNAGEFSLLLETPAPRLRTFDNVSGWTIESSVAPPNLADPIQLTIELEEQATANQVERARLRVTIPVENGG